MKKTELISFAFDFAKIAYTCCSNVDVTIYNDSYFLCIYHRSANNKYVHYYLRFEGDPDLDEESRLSMNKAEIARMKRFINRHSKRLAA